MAAVALTPPRPAGLRPGGRSISPSGRWKQHRTSPKQADGGGFGRGSTVELHGLKQAHELNGLRGTVSDGPDANGRYTVRLPGVGVTAEEVHPAYMRAVQPRGPPQQAHSSPSSIPSTPSLISSRSSSRSSSSPAGGYPAAGSPAKAAADRGGFGLGSTVEFHGRTGSGQQTGGKRARSGRADRRQVRVLVIGTGYGRMANPAQAGMLTNAGFQLKVIDGLPNPEESHHSMASCLEQIKAKIDQFAPHVVTAASKGGPYLVRLWETGMWRGPSVLINAHPSCRQLPRECPIVICQGEEDEVYRVRREAAEALVATGSPDKTLLYWVPSSGRLPQGVRSRHGDTHNMKSLVQNDTLPRLVDAVLDPDGPEMHLVRSWRERLSEGRLQAEARIGYTPEALQRRWQSRGQRGLEDQKLWDVQRNSDEYRCVEEMVRATPTEPAAYKVGPHAAWTRPIVAIQRIENGPQFHGCALPYYDSLRMDIEAQGLNFEPGVHTVWTFHGTDSAAIDSIVNDSRGLRPNFAGSKGATLWGRGTYLARDAKYVGEAGFCGRPAADGTYRMLACLTSIGMPCAADPKHTGLLPYRCEHHRYHSSVDHLSNPEVFVTVQAGATLPAYVITFR